MDKHWDGIPSTRPDSLEDWYKQVENLSKELDLIRVKLKKLKPLQGQIVRTRFFKKVLFINWLTLLLSCYFTQ